MKMLGLGDIVMTLPAILRKNQSSDLYLMIDIKFTSFASKFIGSDKIIPVDYEKIRGGILASIMQLIKINLEVINKNFDQIYILHGHPFYKLIGILQFWKIRHATHSIFNRQSLVSSRYLGYNHYCFVNDCPENSNKFEFDFEIAREIFCRSIPIPNQIDNYVIFAPGYSGNIADPTSSRRRLDIDKWILLANIFKENNVNVKVIGSYAEKEIYTVAFGESVEILCNIRDLSEVGRILIAAKVVITTDNGILHLAYLSKSNIVAIFGPTSPLERIPIFLDNISIITPVAMSCSPCFDGRTVYECDNAACMNNNQPHRIFEVAKKYL